MKKIAATFVASVALVLAIAAPCQAHSLHPIFWGLGPVAPVIAAGAVLGWFALLAIVSLQALILHRVLRGTAFIGHLWRAALIFVLSRVAEIVPAFINGDVFMGSCPDATRFLIVALMFGAGTATCILLIEVLYRRTRPSEAKAIGLSLMIQCVACFGLYAANTALFMAGFVR